MFDIDAWKNETFDDLHYDNALWAYTIRAFEEWRNCNIRRWNNPVFNRLMIMGSEDWMGENHWHAQSIQAMRFVMVMGSRLKQEDIRIEEKVRLQCTHLLIQVIDDVIAGIVGGDNDFEL